MNLIFLPIRDIWFMGRHRELAEMATALANIRVSQWQTIFSDRWQVTTVLWNYSLDKSIGEVSMRNLYLALLDYGCGTSSPEVVSLPVPIGTELRCMVTSSTTTVSYTHLRAHETRHDLVCR